MKFLNRSKTNQSKFDWWLLSAVLAATFIGLVFIFEASSVASSRIFSEPYHFLREQSLWLILGVLILWLTSFFDYHRFYNLALAIILLSLVGLILVFLPFIGVSALGAHRWLNFGGLIVQPAELAKLSLVIYLAAWFSNKEKARLLAFLLLIAVVVSLVILEPDLGTAIIICSTAVILYFISETPLSHLLFLAVTFLVSALGLSIAVPYRFKRLTTFLNPQEDPLGASYHIRQVLLSFGAGGFWGLGLGKSRQKFEYLPEAMTDSIFAILAEEIGFIGAILIIMLFVFILWRGIKIALLAPDKFGQLLAAGIIFSLATQMLINLGAMTVLLPLTGVPLPFISYGGSSLVVSLTGVGILLNISRQTICKRKSS